MKRNVVEWVVVIVSVASIALLVGVLVIEGLNESRPANPTVQLRLDEGRQGALGWIVPANLANDGDRAAEAVVIEATATVEGEPETNELEVDFLPAGSVVEIAFAFSAQPSGEVTVRLVGFRLP